MKTVTISILALAALAIPATAADFESQPQHSAYRHAHGYTHHRGHLAFRAEPRYAAPYAAPAPEPVYSEPSYGFYPFGVVGAALQVPIVALQGTQSIFVPRPQYGTYRSCPC